MYRDGLAVYEDLLHLLREKSLKGHETQKETTTTTT
jgi:hypothetical protein